jgi:flavorubredoxin
MDCLKAVKITDNIYWVGAIDWSIRDFHGYATNCGTTYNAFLILDDNITLIDTVKSPFGEEMLSRISSLIDPRRIGYIVSNHAELDHSGYLPQTIKTVQPKKVFASKMGVKALNVHLELDMEITPVADGENLHLGKRTLTFLETRMLHWPDSMFTYINEDKLLFSQDAFGMHLASSERFDDELDISLLRREAGKYYANILQPYSQMVSGLLNKIDKMGLSFNMLLPDHGPVWRKNPASIIDLYKEWSSDKSERPVKKAVVVYATMWNSTAKMAAAIVDGLISEGISVISMPLSSTHRSDVAYELLDADALIVGSPTLNNNLFPSVADVLVYLKGLKFTGLIGGAFGSYGWGGEAVKQVEGIMREMKIELAADSIRCKYVPNKDILNNCREMGVKLGRALLK